MIIFQKNESGFTQDVNLTDWIVLVLWILAALGSLAAGSSFFVFLLTIIGMPVYGWLRGTNQLFFLWEKADRDMRDKP